MSRGQLVEESPTTSLLLMVSWWQSLRWHNMGVIQCYAQYNTYLHFIDRRLYTYMETCRSPTVVDSVTVGVTVSPHSPFRVYTADYFKVVGDCAIPSKKVSGLVRSSSLTRSFVVTTWNVLLSSTVLVTLLLVVFAWDNIMSSLCFC